MQETALESHIQETRHKQTSWLHMFFLETVKKSISDKSDNVTKVETLKQDLFLYWPWLIQKSY